MFYDKNSKLLFVGQDNGCIDVSCSVQLAKSVFPNRGCCDTLGCHFTVLKGAAS